MESVSTDRSRKRERKKKKHGHGRCSFSVWDLSEFNTYACTLCLIVIYFNIFYLDLIERYFIQYSSYLIFLSLKIQNCIDNTSSVPNYNSFDIFYPKFDHSSYSKIYTKHHFFCCGMLYEYIQVLQE